jgi:hypothetical protein
MVMDVFYRGNSWLKASFNSVRIRSGLVMRFRASECLCAGDLAREFLRSMDQNWKALGANPDFAPLILQ